MLIRVGGAGDRHSPRKLFLICKGMAWLVADNACDVGSAAETFFSGEWPGLAGARYDPLACEVVLEELAKEFRHHLTLPQGHIHLHFLYKVGWSEPSLRPGRHRIIHEAVIVICSLYGAVDES